MNPIDPNLQVKDLNPHEQNASRIESREKDSNLMEMDSNLMERDSSTHGWNKKSRS